MAFHRPGNTSPRFRDKDGVTGEGEGQEKHIQLIRWEDTVTNLILGTETNAPLAYAPGLKIHHPIISMLGVHGGRL